MVQSLWPGVFVGDSALTKNISDLRKALADGSEGTSFIETVPKSGYRFVAPVEVREQADLSPEIVPSVPVAAPAVRGLRWAPVLVVVMLAMVAGWLLLARLMAEPAGRGVRTLAVLPFRPMSAQQRDEYLEIGMADALISQLGATGRLTVRPTGSVRHYATQEWSAVDAGRQLRVDAVLEGDVQRLDNTLRVTARLTRVKDGVLLWAGSIDSTIANLFAVQDSLGRQVMAALSIKLTTAQDNRLAKHATADPEAYVWYQKGRFFAAHRTAEGFEKAIRCYRQAIAEDPRYALAWSGLSDAYMLTAWYYTRPVKEAHALAKEAAIQAIALDDSLAEAHTSMAVVHENADWAFRQAEHEFQKALELNPNYATAHHWYGEFLGLMGRPSDALAHFRRAQQLDPLSTIIGADTAKALIDARRYDEAIQECERTLELDPSFRPARGWLQIAYTWNGMFQQAQAETDRLEAGREPVDASLGKAVFYAAFGQRTKAAEFQRKFQQLTEHGRAQAWQMALMYLQVQPDRDKAIEWLRKAYDERNPYLLALKVAPDFDPIRSDPRFQDLLRRMNFLD